MLDTLEKNKELLKFNAEGKSPQEIYGEALIAGRNAVASHYTVVLVMWPYILPEADLYLS